MASLQAIAYKGNCRREVVLTLRVGLGAINSACVYTFFKMSNLKFTLNSRGNTKFLRTSKKVESVGTSQISYAELFTE